MAAVSYSNCARGALPSSKSHLEMSCVVASISESSFFLLLSTRVCARVHARVCARVYEGDEVKSRPAPAPPTIRLSNQCRLG